jgi:hypothetical protein
MHASIQPEHPLSQVVFLHDYIQLVFHTATFTIYNSSSIEFNGRYISQGSSGFADQLVQQIGRQAQARGVSGEHALSLLFDGGLNFKVTRRDDGNAGPEAFVVHTDAGGIIAEMNE